MKTKTAAPTQETPKPRRRSPGNTITAFSLSDAELQAAKDAAEAEGRTLSSFLRVILKEGIAKRKGKE